MEYRADKARCRKRCGSSWQSFARISIARPTPHALCPGLAGSSEGVYPEVRTIPLQETYQGWEKDRKKIRQNPLNKNSFVCFGQLRLRSGLRISSHTLLFEGANVTLNTQSYRAIVALLSENGVAPESPSKECSGICALSRCHTTRVSPTHGSVNAYSMIGLVLTRSTPRQADHQARSVFRPQSGDEVGRTELAVE